MKELYNMYRLGFTESTLLFFYYLDNYITDMDKSIYINVQYNKIRWLYNTSGFYDKTVNVNDYLQILNSETYNNYFKHLLHSVTRYDGKVTFYFDDFVNSLEKYKVLFFEFIHKEDNKNTPRDDPNYINREFVYRSMQNKNVVIINNLAKLMIQQYSNGNLKQIYHDIPNINNIDYIEPLYTFFNNGPHASILESAQYIYRMVDDKVENVDVFIISAGAYSILIADYIHTNYKKNVVVIGGDLPTFFGINTKRGYMFYKDTLESNREYFINVPEEMKPDNYKAVENGCYW